MTSRGLIGHLKEVYSVAFSPDGTELATASTDDSVRIWSVASGEMIRGPLNAHKFDIWRAVYGRNVSFQFKDQPLLVTGGWDRTVRIWTANTFQELAELVATTTRSATSPSAATAAMSRAPPRPDGAALGPSPHHRGQSFTTIRSG